VKSLPLASLAAFALLAGCGGGEPESGSSGDPRFAGLDQQILAWRTDIEATSDLCREKTDGAGCEGFQVTCKAERTITPEEKAKGVGARIVAAMTYTGKADGRPGSSFAEFTRTGETWTRAETGTVNLTTCVG
jgi:hypothetical protein